MLSSERQVRVASYGGGLCRGRAGDILGASIPHNMARRPSLAPLDPDFEPDDAFDDDAPRRGHRGARNEPEPLGPYAWLKAGRMSQTEVSLRFASYLITRQLTSSPVSVALTGGELHRTQLPRFPVAAFLEAQGFAKNEPGWDWRCAYTMGRAPATLVLHDRFDMGDIAATLHDGRRILVEATGGPVEATRSPTEKKLFSEYHRARAHQLRPGRLAAADRGHAAFDALSRIGGAMDQPEASGPHRDPLCDGGPRRNPVGL